MNELIKTDLRRKTFELQNAILKFPQIDIPVKHYFSYGVYAREITIPEDAIFVGELHKFENLNILSKGELSVSIDGKIERIKAPYTFVAPAGSKRVFWAHTECIWTTIHGTFEKNVNEIEKIFIAKNEKEFLEFINDSQLRLL